MEEEKYRSFADSFHENGVGEYIKLPQIVVMGDTSSGKSSLLSMISNIPFPSSDKLTTRCPTRLHMDKASVKEYKVSITWHSSSAYRDNGFQTRHLSSINLISKAISDAQEYILSKAGKNVSPDIVEVDFRDPEGVELTLIDLPGIVRTVGMGEDEDLGTNINALMKEYLDNERCVILAVVPGNVDFHNNQIIADAKKVDPSTERTIPVITKPDLIDKGAEGGVLDLLLGKKIECNLGFHIVKCRGQEAVNNGITMSEGLTDERKFFAETSPWKEIENRSLFGIKHLREKLASVQTDLLRKSIPSIRNEIILKKEEAINQLTKLGTHLDTDKMRRIAFANYLNDLIKGIDENVNSSQKMAKSLIWRSKDGFTLRSEIEKINSKFSKEILGTKLASMETLTVGSNVLVNIKGAQCKGTIYSTREKNEKQVYYIDPTVASDKEKFFEKGKFNDSKGMHINEHFQYDDQSEGIVRSEIVASKSVLVVASKSVLENSKSWNTDDYVEFVSDDVAMDHSSWLLDYIQKNKTRDLAIFPSSTIFNGIVRDFVSEKWAKLAENLVNKTAEVFEEFVDWIVHQIVPESLPKLCHFLLKQLISILNTSTEIGRHECHRLLSKEEEPYTQNHYLSENFMKQRMSGVKRLLDSGNDPATIVAQMTNYVSRNQNISNDEFAAREMQMALSAYGKVAAKRVIDSVPMAIENQIAGQLAEKTRIENIDIMSNNEELLSLMSEPQNIRTDRMKWEKLKDVMTAANEALNRLQ